MYVDMVESLDEYKRFHKFDILNFQNHFLDWNRDQWTETDWMRTKEENIKRPGGPWIPGL